MKCSLVRIIAVLCKDIKSNFILIILFPFISIVMFYLPSLFINIDYKIAFIVKEQIINNDSEHGNYYYYENESNALNQLNSNKIHSIINIEKKTIAMNDQKTVPSKEIQKAINFILGGEVLAEEINKDINISAMMGSVLLTITSFFVGPIIFLGEASTNTFKALLLTYLEYHEYLLCKLFFCIFVNMTSILSFFYATNYHNISFHLIIYVLFVSVIMSLFSAILSSLFVSLEKAMWFISPIMIVLIILEFSIWLEKFLPGFSIQSGFAYILDTKGIQLITIIFFMLVILVEVFIFILQCKKNFYKNLS